MCFDDLQCWEGVCIPGSPPNDSSSGDGDGDGDGEETGSGSEECEGHADCPGASLCGADPQVCVPPGFAKWDAFVAGLDVDCSDTFSASDFVLYKYRWDPIQDIWLESSWRGMDALYEDTWLAVVVYEEDLTDYEYCGEFQFMAGEAIEAWKVGTTSVFGALSGTGELVEIAMEPS